MTAKHWILLSAPPKSGKDTFTNLWFQKHRNTCHIKLSQPLKDGLRAFFALTPEEFAYFETPENKSIKHKRLNGLSWRQAQIDLAEILVKPQWGRDTFSQIAYDKACLANEDYVIVSDLGFAFELEWLSKQPTQSITVVNIVRNGCSFDGDSREWVYFDALQLHRNSKYHNIQVLNNGAPENMLSQDLFAWLLCPPKLVNLTI